MKTAKELADRIRPYATCERAEVFGDELHDIASHLDRLDAIDSAALDEVGPIAKRCADVEVASIDTEAQDKAFEYSKLLAPKDRATLLAIVQRQARETEDRRALYNKNVTELINQVNAVTGERDEARAEVAHLTERLRKMQHGEAEALKMMAEEKQRANFELHNATVAQAAIIELEADVRDLRAETGATILKLRAESTEQRERAEVLARGIMVYRRHWDLDFKETAKDVLAWEDEHGKTVP